MRLFIAINLAPEIGINLEAALIPLRGIFGDSRWVPGELMHMTLKVLGERDQSFAERTAAGLDEVAARYRRIPMTISGIGAFPNLRRPSVVWVGVQADPKLELVSHDVENLCATLGVPVDGRPFRPHVTVARVKSARAAAVGAFAEAARSFSFEAHYTAGSIDLMLSEQKAGRLTYTRLHGAQLRD